MEDCYKIEFNLIVQFSTSEETLNPLLAEKSVQSSTFLLCILNAILCFPSGSSPAEPESLRGLRDGKICSPCFASSNHKIKVIDIMNKVTQKLVPVQVCATEWLKFRRNCGSCGYNCQGGFICYNGACGKYGSRGLVMGVLSHPGGGGGRGFGVG